MRICLFVTPGFAYHDTLERILAPYMSAGLCDIYYRTCVDETSLKTDACIKAFALKHRLCYAPFIFQTASQLLRMKDMFDYVIVVQEQADVTLDKLTTLIKLSKFRVFRYTYSEEELRTAHVKKKFNKVTILPTIRE